MLYVDSFTYSLTHSLTHTQTQVPSRAAPELHCSYSGEKKIGDGETKIGDAVELVFLVRLKDVLVKNRGGLSSVQDYNTELMKAMQWLNTKVLDVARKDKGEAPASMCAVPNEGKLGLDIVRGFLIISLKYLRTRLYHSCTFEYYDYCLYYSPRSFTRLRNT